MKKIYCLALALTLVLGVSAQGQVEKREVLGHGKEVKKIVNNNTKDSVYTGYYEYYWNNVTTNYTGAPYGSSGVPSGFMFGTNVDSSSFGVGNMVDGGVGILGAYVWHGLIDTTSATHADCNIRIRAAYMDNYVSLYSVSEATGDTTFFNTYAPGSVIAEASLSIRDIDTARFRLLTPGDITDTTFYNGWNTVFFDQPYYVENDFAIVWSGEECAKLGDTVTVVTGEIPSLENDEYLWMTIKLGSSEYSWIKVVDNFSFEPGKYNTPALFAIVDDAFVGINEEGNFFQNYQMSFYPNPATDVVNVEYALKEDANTNIVISSMNGQIVYKTSSEMKKSGVVYSENINVSDFAAGTYIISVGNDAKRLVKKMIIK